MDKTKVKNILLITLSNIGDVILTLPVLGVLEREFPKAKISVMVSQQAEELFRQDPRVKRVIVYNKHIPFLQKVKLALRLRKRNFDMVVDLRNSIFPFIIGSRYRSSLFNKKPLHRKDKHLSKLISFGFDIDNVDYKFTFSQDGRINIDSIFKEFNIAASDKLVALAPGAKSHIKRWTVSGFAKVCERLNKQLGIKVLLIGDDSDKQVISQIFDIIRLNDAYDIAGRTNLVELAYLLSQCQLLITNDSAPLHLASLMGTPSIAIFGPTDHKKYGPFSNRSVVIRKGLKCSPCEKAQCVYNLECMSQVDADEVFEAAKQKLGTATMDKTRDSDHVFNRDGKKKHGRCP